MSDPNGTPPGGRASIGTPAGGRPSVARTSMPAATGLGEGTVRAIGRTWVIGVYVALRNLKMYPVENAVVQKGLKPDSAEIAYIPTTTVPVTEVGIARTIVKLHDTLEEHDDVQAVFSNEEMDEAVSAAI